MCAALAGTVPAIRRRMGKHNGEIVRAGREHAFALFRSAADRAPLEYHNFPRTRDVVDACKDIAKGCKLDDESREVVLLCAWFYDTCYATDSDDHDKSLALCTEFLEAQHAHRPTIERIADCFRGATGADHGATERSAIPAGGETASDVLHDARIAVLASKDYVEQAELLRLEMQRRSGTSLTDLEWTQRCIAFAEAHAYRTRYAQVAYGAQRAGNLARLQKLLRKQQRDLDEAHTDANRQAKGAAKTVESMFYHFTRLHISLFEVADRRTNTMVHVNALMMTIVVALLARRISTDRDLLLPTTLLLCVNLAVVFLAVHSLRAPRVSFTSEEARLHDSNLLGLMNEKSLSLPEYAREMDALVADPMQYQRKVIEQLYFGRKALAARTKALRRTYDVFLYGVALAMVGFVVTLARR